MSGLSAEYGETPISYDEVEVLVPEVRALLGEPVLKAAVYDLEQTIESEVRAEAVGDVLQQRLTLDTALSDCFVRDLHRRVFGEIWLWAGRLRTVEVTIGVAPEYVAVELRQSLDQLLYRWRHTDDWSARELGMAVHAETVRIHPFVDGNGRTTRLLAELVFMAARGAGSPQTYDWDVDKRRYIDLLREYDQSRDPRRLAAFVPVIDLNGS